MHIRQSRHILGRALFIVGVLCSLVAATLVADHGVKGAGFSGGVTLAASRSSAAPDLPPLTGTPVTSVTQSPTTNCRVSHTCAQDYTIQPNGMGPSYGCDTMCIAGYGFGVHERLRFVVDISNGSHLQGSAVTSANGAFVVALKALLSTRATGKLTGKLVVRDAKSGAIISSASGAFPIGRP